MRKRYAELPTAFAAWIYPPAPTDQGQTAAELQRARISHFLPPILLIGFFATISAFFLHRLTGGPAYITLRIINQAALITICLILCHARRAHVAAWIYCGWITVTTLFIVLHPGQPQYVPTISVSLSLLMPIFSAGILLD